jgi:hypothetical protein
MPLTGGTSVKLVEIHDYPFNRVEIIWHGPFPWTKTMGAFDCPKELRDRQGLYRAETAGLDRSIIKYIGSASEGFAARLTGQHSIKHKLVDGARRRVRMYLGVVVSERKLTLTRNQYVELEYVLQNVHWHDLISWHGLSKLPKTSRGEGWHIVNKGQRSPLHRVVAYPAFAVSGKDA